MEYKTSERTRLLNRVAKKRYRLTEKAKLTRRAYQRTEKFKAYARALHNRRYAEGHRPSLRYWHSRRGQDKVLQRKFGISLEEKERKYKEQKGLCALCKEPLPFNSPVEHCHKTNRFRGLVHHRCNVFIGLVENYPAMLKNIGQYLDG